MTSQAWTTKVLILMEVIAAAYGIYSEIPGLPLQYFPPGMGWAVAVIAFTMFYVLITVTKEREARKNDFDDFKVFVERVGTCIAVHEQKFYSLWRSHFEQAQRNVDITHLGPRPPKYRKGQPEHKYYSDLKNLVTSSPAQVRRVERLTTHKMGWIQSLLDEYKGVANFSLAVYKDPLGEAEMPAAISVCRADDSYAWIVAPAEQISTLGLRDILITSKEGVETLRLYFEQRLWNGSQTRVIMRNGELIAPGWQK